MASPLINEAVDAVVSHAGKDGFVPETNPVLTKVIAQLDAHYWERVERTISSSVKGGADISLFTKEERLVLDAGLIDDRLILPVTGEKAANPAEFRVALLKELYGKGAPGHFYFSQWLVERFRWFILYGKMDQKEEKQPDRGKEETKVIRMDRTRIYTALHPLFTNLPGFPEKVVSLFFSGQLDSAIDALTAHITSREDTIAAEQRKKLIEMRARLIERARERAKTDEELALFDELHDLDGKLRDARKPKEAMSVSEKIGQVSKQERIAFLLGEIKLVRSLLRLGVTGSGITRTHSVLLSSQRRMTKPDITPLLAMVKEADPNLPAAPHVLIAPYIGTGFYEWDRDTLFVPLLSTRSPEESLITAIANYRIMLDTLQEGARLKRAYEMKFGKSDFRNGFIRDYRAWVLSIGRGFKGAMDQENYDFFKDYIGPSAGNLFAPRELSGLTPAERKEVIKECRGRLNRAEGGWDDHYKLAAIYWKEARVQEALEQMTMCARLDPTDGRVLLGLAHIFASLGINDKARRTCEECVEMAPNSIWQIYAADALHKL